MAEQAEKTAPNENKPMKFEEFKAALNEEDKKYLEEELGEEDMKLLEEILDAGPRLVNWATEFALNAMLTQEKCGCKPNQAMKKHSLKKEYPNIEFKTAEWQKWVSVCVSNV